MNAYLAIALRHQAARLEAAAHRQGAPVGVTGTNRRIVAS